MHFYTGCDKGLFIRIYIYICYLWWLLYVRVGPSFILVNKGDRNSIGKSTKCVQSLHTF